MKNEVEKQVDKMIMDTHNAQIRSAKGPLSVLIGVVLFGSAVFLFIQLLKVIF